MSALAATSGPGPGLVSGLAGVLAHQGGWDELGLVLAPLVVVAGLLVIANRRAKRLVQEQATAEVDATGAPTDGAPER
jgi:hypothetical protein